MSSTCGDLAPRILAHAGDASAFEDDLRAHVAGCAVCADVASRAARAVEHVRALERRPVPETLDGRVVAALHAGHREERVAAELRALRRASVPRELESKLFVDPAAARSDAPRVLERLVAEDLADPGRVAARRAARRLERLRAQESLLARVDAAIRAGEPRRRARPAAIAAVVALALGCAGWLVSRARTASEPRYRFDVVYAKSLDGLEPITLGFLSGVSGGVADVAARRASSVEGEPR